VASVIILDASVIIAYLDPHDAHHEAAVEQLARASTPFIVHPITAAEVLVGPTTRGLADQVWHILVEIGVVVDDRPVDPHQLARIRHKTGCKLPDCCVLASAASHGALIATFDQKLARVSEGLGVATNPTTSELNDRLT
jgi:predicted nucleic acid-binding protein